ncbi:MAG: hypothetical protein R3336_00470, partial [Phycisphaeraceae bacterium]|nr:hypothetical protein [Phycisphaeraceae bacterium]
TLALAGHKDRDEAVEAFEAAAKYLGLPDLSLLDAGACSLSALDEALDRIEHANLGVRKRVLDACMASVEADGEIARTETELVRGIADTLGCPLPIASLRAS